MFDVQSMTSGKASLSELPATIAARDQAHLGTAMRYRTRQSEAGIIAKAQKQPDSAKN